MLDNLLMDINDTTVTVLRSCSGCRVAGHVGSYSRRVNVHSQIT